MIVISLDESGSFEGKGGAVRLIGGLIYRHNEIEEKEPNKLFQEEKDKIEKYLKDTCSELGFAYPSGIHGIDIKDTKKKYQLKEALKKYLKESGRYHFTCIIKSKEDKKNYINNSSLTDDKYASNLYERMATSLINNTLFYNDIFKNEVDVNFEVATRSIPIENDNLEEIEKYKKLGYRFTSSYNRKKNKEETWFYLTNQQTFKVATSIKMVEDKINRNIDPQYNVESINYYRTFNDEKRETTPFLYLADLACDIIRDYINVSRMDFNVSKISEEAEKITGNPALIWAYDDIDDNYTDIYENIENNKYIESLEALYNFETSKSSFKRFYENKWLSNVSEKVNNLFNKEFLSLYADEVDRYLGKSTAHSKENVKDINLGIYIGEKILCNIEKSDSIDQMLKYKIADQLLMGYNQRGNIEKAKEMFKICNELKRIIGVDNFCGTCLSLAQTSANEFDFDSSITYMNSALDVIIKKKENSESDIYSIFNDDSIEEEYKDDSKLIILGKVYSSLGQFNCFKGNYDEAFKYFNLALEEFKYDNLNFRLTTSYMMHLLIEMDNKKLYDEYSLKIFENESIAKQLNSIIKRKDRFELNVLLKAIVRFNLNINNEMLEEMKKIILSSDAMWVKNSSPWQVINKYLAIIFFNNSYDKLVETCINSIGTLTIDREREITLHTISLYNEIEARYICDKDRRVLNNKINQLKEVIEKNEKINNYLKSSLDEKTAEDIIKKLKRKLVFLYS